MKKICSRCKEEKPLEAFGKKGTGKQPHCKECQKVKIREWYQANKEHQKTRVKLDKQRMVEQIQTLKQGVCTDCKGVYPPCAMDWDHVRGVKVDNVSNLVREGAINKALDEIVKCELVCANCHRIRTHSRIHASLAQ